MFTSMTWAGHYSTQRDILVALMSPFPFWLIFTLGLWPAAWTTDN